MSSIVKYIYYIYNMKHEEILKQIQDGANRKCNRCGEVKKCNEFYIKKGKTENQYRFNSPCIECIYKSGLTEESRQYQKYYNKKWKFNINKEDYIKMLDLQKNKCLICNIDKDKVKKDFAVDHCHKTGKVRGLLCSNCNTGIGMFNDNIDNLLNAIKYLKGQLL